MSIQLTRNHVGTICLDKGTVEITDPCYTKNVWCRMEANVMPGTYNCYAYRGVDGVWGSRIWINQIVIADGDEAAYAEELANDTFAWEEIGEIGVDAGMAGFFRDKPNFSEKEWRELCDWLCHCPPSEHNPNGIKDAYVKSFATGDGFWTESGCGDGAYCVYALKKDGVIVALEIRF